MIKIGTIHYYLHIKIQNLIKNSLLQLNLLQNNQAAVRCDVCDSVLNADILSLQVLSLQVFLEHGLVFLHEVDAELRFAQRIQVVLQH